MMTLQDYINYYMSMGKSKAEATRLAQDKMKEGSSGTPGVKKVLLYGPTTETKTVGRPGMPGKVSTIVPGKSIDLDKAIAMFYGNDAESKNIQKQLSSALSKLGYTGLSNVQMASIWENLVKQSADQVAVGYNQTPWDLLPLMVKPNVAGQAIQTYVTNYFTKSGKPTAAANQLLKDSLTEVLGHVPSADEIKEYAPLLSEMRSKQQSGLFTGKTDSRTGVSTPGLDPKTWLAEQVRNKYQARVQYGKDEAKQSTLDRYVRLASEYGYNPYDTSGNLSEAARLQLSKIEAGKMTLDDAQEAFKQAALSKYSYLKPQFDAGLTLQQIANPAINAISSILEKDPNSITVNDPMVQKYLYGVDGKGVMPLYKYEASLRQDPSWQFTNNARSQFADLAAFIGGKFGINV